MPDSETAARFLSSLGLNKGKQITKMEIFKLAFRGIQIVVWVARRHRPRSCCFVIKMIPKIPPCCGFHPLARLVSLPLRRSPSSGARPPAPLDSLGPAPVESSPLRAFLELSFPNAVPSAPSKTHQEVRGAPGKCWFCAGLRVPGERGAPWAFHPRRGDRRAPGGAGAWGGVSPFPSQLGCALSPP